MTKRYKFLAAHDQLVFNGREPQAKLVVDPEGKYVEWSDYDDMRRERDHLLNEIDDLKEYKYMYESLRD